MERSRTSSTLKNSLNTKLANALETSMNDTIYSFALFSMQCSTDTISQ